MAAEEQHIILKLDFYVVSQPDSGIHCVVSKNADQLRVVLIVAAC